MAAYRIYADRIAFYSNRYVLGADGHVVVILGDGTRLTGNTLFNDLRLNRFVIAGDVTLTAAGTTLRGAAFAEYFDFDRAYFVPIISEPDRWTFSAGDYAHPLFGREMPGDTFFLPDLSGQGVFLTAKHATVDPRQSVRFDPADINFGFAHVTFPTYFLNYSTNPNFAQNALNGAFADGPLDFAGGEHGLATAHIRYDSVDHLFFAYEQHQVSDNHYLVVSVNPLTRPLKQYNFLGYDRLSPGLQVQLELQETAFQHDFSLPLSATAYGNLLVTGSLPHSYLQFTDVQYYDSLLARPPTFVKGPGGATVYYYGDPSHDWIPYHPNALALTWTGFRHQINRLPLTFQLRSSYGQVNDPYGGLQTLGGVEYYTEYVKSAGANLATKSLYILRDPSGHHYDLYFTGSVDKQRQWYSLPHHIDTTLINLALTKVVNSKVTLLAEYTNTNTGDFYGAQQLAAYPAKAVYYNPFTLRNVAVSPGFRGFGTVRSFIQQLVFNPSHSVTFNATLRENDDFPRPLPGPLQLVGDGNNFVNYGQTPYEADLDLRFRFTQVLVLDISRSYYFNFAGFEGWTPQFSFQIEK